MMNEPEMKQYQESAASVLGFMRIDGRQGNNMESVSTKMTTATTLSSFRDISSN